MQHTPLFFDYSLGVLIGSNTMYGSTIKVILEQFIKPDLVFYLNVPQSVRIERMYKRDSAIDVLHEKLAAKDDSDFMKKPNEHYGGRFVVLDGTKNAEEINKHMYKNSPVIRGAMHARTSHARIIYPLCCALPSLSQSKLPASCRYRGPSILNHP